MEVDVASYLRIDAIFLNVRRWILFDAIFLISPRKIPHLKDDRFLMEIDVRMQLVCFLFIRA